MVIVCPVVKVIGFTAAFEVSKKYPRLIPPMVVALVTVPRKYSVLPPFTMEKICCFPTLAVIEAPTLEIVNSVAAVEAWLPENTLARVAVLFAGCADSTPEVTFAVRLKNTASIKH
jgi:hypothetical protein